MKIITNNVPRKLISSYELTDKEREDFDWCDDIDSEHFVRYRGIVYAVSEFMRIDDMDNWSGYYACTMSNCVLIRLVDDDTVVMGMGYC